MTAPNETLYVDPDVAFAGHRTIRDGNAVEAARGAFNDAVTRAQSHQRTPLMVEVIVRVAPAQPLDFTDTPLTCGFNGDTAACESCQ